MVLSDETSETLEVDGPQAAEDGQSNSENCPLTDEAAPVADSIVQEDAQVEAADILTGDSNKPYTGWMLSVLFDSLRAP